MVWDRKNLRVPAGFQLPSFYSTPWSSCLRKIRMSWLSERFTGKWNEERKLGRRGSLLFEIHYAKSAFVTVVMGLWCSSQQRRDDRDRLCDECHMHKILEFCFFCCFSSVSFSFPSFSILCLFKHGNWNTCKNNSNTCRIIGI